METLNALKMKRMCGYRYEYEAPPFLRNWDATQVAEDHILDFAMNNDPSAKEEHSEWLIKFLKHPLLEVYAKSLEIKVEFCRNYFNQLAGNKPVAFMSSSFDDISGKGFVQFENRLITASLSPFVFDQSYWEHSLDFLICYQDSIRYLDVLYLDSQVVVTYDLESNRTILDGLFQLAWKSIERDLLVAPFPEPKINPTCPSCSLKTKCKEYNNALSTAQTNNLSAWLRGLTIADFDNLDVRIGLQNARTMLKGLSSILEHTQKELDKMILDYIKLKGVRSISVSDDNGLGLAITQQNQPSIPDVTALKRALEEKGMWDDTLMTVSATKVRSKIGTSAYSSLVDQKVIVMRPLSPYLTEQFGGK
jgi:hypothetical protein